MDDREIRKLSRLDLLEILAELSRENEQLRAELNAAKEELKSRKIHISEAGSIAEASLKLNRVFEDAQAAAEQYLENLVNLERQKQAEINAVRELRRKLDEKSKI